MNHEDSRRRQLTSNVLKIVQHRMDRFTYVRDSRSLVTEASDFNGARIDGPIYSDAADVGFWVVSHKTGMEKPFALWETKTDRDGDVTSWEYREISPVSGRPVENGFKVVVFND